MTNHCSHVIVIRTQNGKGEIAWKCRDCHIPFKPVVPGGRFDPAVNPFAN